MPKIPGISPHDAVRVFSKLGFRVVRQSGHIVLSNIPINAITMGSIARDAGLTPDQFRALL